MSVKFFIASTILIILFSRFVANYEWDTAIWVGLIFGFLLSIKKTKENEE